MIHLSGVNKSYAVGGRSLHVLRDVDLGIAAGEMVAVMGSSGSGKSTLLNILGLLDSPDSGAYDLAGASVLGLTEKEAALVRNRKIGFVFQSFHLLPFKDATENVALPLYYQGLPKKERNRIAEEALEQVGLADWNRHRPAQLSGGQQQRVAIARAIVTKPSVILADEPTGALDSETSKQVISLLRVQQGSGITVVVVTHEEEIASLCDRTIRLVDGVVVEK